jgi:hypothetical protein
MCAAKLLCFQAVSGFESHRLHQLFVSTNYNNFRGAALNHFRSQHCAHHLSVRQRFALVHGLPINMHRGANVRAAHQFLLHFMRTQFHPRASGSCCRKLCQPIRPMPQRTAAEINSPRREVLGKPDRGFASHPLRHQVCQPTFSAALRAANGETRGQTALQNVETDCRESAFLRLKPILQRILRDDHCGPVLRTRSLVLMYSTNHRTASRKFPQVHSGGSTLLAQNA